MDPRGFLLYTAQQERLFRTKHASFVRDYLDQYEKWFYQTFPLYDWKPLQLPANKAEIVIGMLCLLYRTHRIQFSIRFLSDTEAEIQREALTSEECKEYWNNLVNKTKL